MGSRRSRRRRGGPIAVINGLLVSLNVSPIPPLSHGSCMENKVEGNLQQLSRLSRKNMNKHKKVHL